MMENQSQEKNETLSSRYKNYHHNYYIIHREKIRLKQKEYYESNREKVRMKQQQYYEGNMEKIKKKKQEWYEINKRRVNKNRLNNYYKNKDVNHIDNPDLTEGNVNANI